MKLQEGPPIGGPMLVWACADPVARAGRSSLKPAMLGVFSRYESYYPEDLPRILANQLGIVDDLVSAGASIDVRDWYTGRTLLLEVAGMSHDDGSPAVLLKGLIERGADVQARDSEGRTALMIAVSVPSTVARHHGCHTSLSSNMPPDGASTSTTTSVLA